MPEAKVAKTFIRPDKTAVITCPHCGRQETLHVESFNKGHKSKLKIKCSCKNIYTANLEYRSKIRKRTQLRGTYVNHSQKDMRGKIKVINVSVSGLEFTSLDAPNFNIDDQLTLEFALNDDYRTEIKKEAYVRNVRTKSVGCEFEGSGDIAHDGELGLYIRQ
jgi:hypothetical protein